MINLIPPQARKDIITEYWVRVITVWMFILSAFSVIAAILLLPVYVLVTSQVEAYSSSATEAAEKVAEYDLSATTLVETNKQAQMIIGLSDVQNFSEIVVLIESLNGNDVSVSSFDFIREDKKISPIQASGKAASRQSLIDFRDRLLQHPAIDSVDLPISNLAKDKDIPFSITVRVVEEEKS